MKSVDDILKQSESTDEDDESSLVSSVIDRSELDRKTSERGLYDRRQLKLLVQFRIVYKFS